MSADGGTGVLLRQTRISAGKTLDELSVETQINIQYLREIEAGGDFSLPEIYRRTFIRTYAKTLGLDLEELFEPEEDGPYTDRAPDDPDRVEVSVEPPVESTAASPVFSGPLSDRSQIRSMVIIVLFLVTAFVLAVKWLGSGTGDDAVTGQGTTEQSLRSRPVENLSAFNQDRDTRGAEPEGSLGAVDSLVLVATSSESVWVHIVLDNDSAVEYTMPPRYSVTLRAAENFLLAVGNPAGLSLTLNGRRLDILGDGNRPKKNILLSRKTLAR